MFIRYESAVPSPSGRHPGVFALANDLAHSGILSEEEWRWWRQSNDWFNAAYIDPADVEPTIFERSLHSHTQSWFRTSAVELCSRAREYLHLLDAHGVEWRELLSTDPGEVLYADDNQVIVQAWAV